MSLDVEQDMMRLIREEFNFHRELEDKKQWYESYLDYDAHTGYLCIDSTSIGSIYVKSLDSFFKKNFIKGRTNEDCEAIIRRLDLDGDHKLSPDEFKKGMATQEPFSKMIVREAIKKEENFGANYEKWQEE